jgi:hypothetical protein
MYYLYVMDGQLFTPKDSTMGMGSGGENTYFAKVLCHLENRPCDFSVVTVNPAQF